ncbi:hypothetical protein [Methylomonas albis]|uniref:Transposase n=1 Tax=Methylomonas albis TaxID=1854563 RepID=A0ABR9D6Y1_9GAMM|nr:transposase [Methylomonas albis]MBD9358876.1 transposase [Methylomonas albis]CAD6882348.1 hypothetical protein [Methylomonas albis]
MSKEKPSTYSAEFRASAVKLANESDKSISQVAQDLGINVNTLHTWIGKFSQPKDSNKTVRTNEHLHDELKRFKKEMARLTEELELLKKAAAYFAKAQRSTARMQEVGQLRSGCREVRLDKTAFRGIYGGCHVPAYECIPKRLLRTAEALPYGTRSLKAALSAPNRTVSRRLLREAALVSKTKRKFKATTSSKHHQPIADNLLDRQFAVESPIRSMPATSPIPQHMKAGCICPWS